FSEVLSFGALDARFARKRRSYFRPSLKAFDLKVVINAFQDTCAKFEFDFQIGRAEALKTVAKIKKKEDAARLLIRVCCAIGGADGHFDEAERAMCRTLCNELGLNPADFDL
ncbi:TerB family tellurite resistance protein, partial [Pseudomonas sp. CCI1.2]|uniref:tellurite resistance TerB family protein n=1 Tax=Pseudomonas sp. CCI1.2 TaxID=3048614 RepID=UPI002B224AA8